MASVEQAPAPQAGFTASANGLRRNLAALLRTRAELLAIELKEETERRKEMLILAGVGAFFGALGLQLVAFLVVVIFWDSYRIAAISGVTGLYVGIAGWAFLRLRYKLRSSPTPFAASLEELAKDLDALQGQGRDA